MSAGSGYWYCSREELRIDVQLYRNEPYLKLNHPALAPGSGLPRVLWHPKQVICDIIDGLEEVLAAPSATEQEYADGLFYAHRTYDSVEFEVGNGTVFFTLYDNEIKELLTFLYDHVGDVEPDAASNEAKIKAQFDRLLGDS